MNTSKRTEAVREIGAFSELYRGAVVRSKLTDCSYVVDAVYGTQALAVCSVSITHLDEWLLVDDRTRLVNRGA